MDLFNKILTFLGFKVVKPRSIDRMLSFNHAELATKMQKLQVSLNVAHQDEAFRLIADAIETSRNIQVLEINRMKPGSDSAMQISHAQGRLEALSDLVYYLEHAKDIEFIREITKKSRDEEKQQKPRILRHKSEPAI